MYSYGPSPISPYLENKWHSVPLPKTTDFLQRIPFQVVFPRVWVQTWENMETRCFLSHRRLIKLAFLLIQYRLDEDPLKREPDGWISYDVGSLFVSEGLTTQSTSTITFEWMKEVFSDRCLVLLFFFGYKEWVVFEQNLLNIVEFDKGVNESSVRNIVWVQTHLSVKHPSF